MPSALTYPGVYIEEVSSGVRTITGVATSITAFIGRALRGPVNEPTTINNYGDFERQFGGLAIDYPLSYAVRDFYLNGGSQAIIVRLYKSQNSTNDTADSGKASFTIDGLKIFVKSQGTWGNKLSASIDVEVSDEVRTRLALTETDVLFNLIIQLGDDKEKILNVTNAKDSARRIDRVLKSESSLVDFGASEWPVSQPVMTATKNAAGKYREFIAAKKNLDATPDDAAKKTAYSTAETAYNTAKAGLTGTAVDGLDSQQPVDYEGSKDKKTGLYALDKSDLFNLLCIPPDTREGNTPNEAYQLAMSYCKQRRAMLIVDPPAQWSKIREIAADEAKKGLPGLGLLGEAARNAALYFPRLLQADPLRDGQLDTFVPCGAVAGIIARTDTQRGVWKAPAGLDASINGIQGLDAPLNDAENGMLNPLGINCLRTFPAAGRVVWGARTLRGNDQLADEWKYIPVRRTALFIEESLYRGTQWVVFEPNDEPLWAQIRLNVGSFMHNLFRQGAFQGTSPKEAYFVKCDKETNPQNDIDRGIVNILVGFAPLKPAEFVVVKLQQIAGNLEV